MAQLAETIGTLILLGSVCAIFYGFYKLLKFALSAVKDNDD